MLALVLPHVLRLISWPMGAIVRTSGAQKNEGFGRNRVSRGGWEGGGWCGIWERRHYVSCHCMYCNPCIVYTEIL